MMDSFKHRNKDLVFLVNINQSDNSKITQVKDSLKQIFDRGLEAHDRISLITFAKNARIIFSLVDKGKNFTQLRNQIDRIEMNPRSQTNLYKGLVEAIKEFRDSHISSSPRGGGGATLDRNGQRGSKNGLLNGISDVGSIADNHKYIICFTNEDCSEGQKNTSRITKDSVQQLLREYGINLIIMSFGQVSSHSQSIFEELTNVTTDGRVLSNPNHDVIKDLFLQISNYKFQSTPLILETFN